MGVPEVARRGHCGSEMDGEAVRRGSGPSGTTECVKGKGVVPGEGRLIGVKYSPE